MYREGVVVPLVLRTTRNGVVERQEYGQCVVTDAAGSVLWHAGDPDYVTYLRSSAKPFQATALALSGAVDRFGLNPAHVAIACGSHHAEPDHVLTALDMLRRAGVSPAALQCGAHDLAEPEASRLARAGIAPTPLHNNCSGKHAGMLAAAQALGAPLGSYLDPEHPVQRLIARTLAQVSGLSPEGMHLGIDGCSAPNVAMPMRAMACAFARLGEPERVGGEVGAALAHIGAAMRRHPWMVSGTTGFDTALMGHAGIPLISKGGAEGLHCVALPTRGLGLAVKIESGRADRIGAVTIAILRGLGVLGATLHPALARFDAPPVRNHRGLLVGETQVLLDTGALAQIAARDAHAVG
jgi:L-asparaginase II